MVINNGGNILLKSKGLKIYNIVMATIYTIALSVCLVCNLALQGGTLSWFFIVLAAVAIAFSITNLPFLLNNFRLIIPALSVTILLYVLLYVCSIYTGGRWLYRYAYPIATPPVAVIWMILLVIRWRGPNWYYKAALLSFLSAVLTLSTDIWVEAVLAGKYTSFADFLDFGSYLHFNENFGNFIGAVCCLVISLTAILMGVAASSKSRRVKKHSL